MAILGRLVKSWRHQRYAARLVDYADDRLPAAERQRLAHHIEGCADCGASFDALRSVPDRLRASAVEPDEAFWRRQRQDIMGAIRDLPDPAAEEPRARVVLDLRLALPVAVAAAIAIAGYLSLSRPAEPVSDVALRLEYLQPDSTMVLAEVAEMLVPTQDLAADLDLSDGAALGAVVREGWAVPGSATAPADLEGLSDEDLETLAGFVG